jgi:DNA mismatch repair protein MutS
MLTQYFEVKKAHPDAIVFFRMGDFFEMFYDDAILASRLLEITLTSRGPRGGAEPPIPMAGVPATAVDQYVARLVKLGRKVALCDQVEDARAAKGLVRREVVRIATPGTTADPLTVTGGENVFLAALVRKGGVVGFGFADLSTGRLDTGEVEVADAAARLIDEFARYRPREVLLPAGSGLAEVLPPDHGAALTERPSDPGDPRRARERLERHLGVASLSGFGLDGKDAAAGAAGLLLAYLEETQRASLGHLRSLAFLHPADYLTLDAATARNLELVRSLADGTAAATLLAVVDCTRTAMGARLLRDRLLRPSARLEVIEARLAATAALHDDGPARARLRDQALNQVHDLERLLSRVTLRTANARDLLALKDSLRALPELKRIAAGFEAGLLVRLAGAIDELGDVALRLEQAIAEDAPASIREGGLIRKGFDPRLDELKSIASEGRSWIAAYEARERQATGIASLKVRYNRVFGYSIEVTRSNLGAVPPRYERRQTLANAERYTTAELKEYEAKVLDAEEKLLDLEYEAFARIRDEVGAEAPRIARSAGAVAELDLLAAAAAVAARDGWCRPRVEPDGAFTVSEGRHPVVQAGLGGERFVPNDLLLDPAARQVLLVTGPNMGGKSTYLRQTALIAILAHAGFFVPARSAVVPLLDRVFTRVGASDDLVRGRSTFMVEMLETANILHHATSRSLVILDEVGRGTATFDGLSLAWAIVEHLHDHPRGRPLTLFATHYHELTDLADLLARVKNARVAVAQHQGQVVFLKRIEDGRSDRSYGIEVARLAGLPPAVVARAREVLKHLEAVELGLEERLRQPSTTDGAAAAPRRAQLTLFVPASHPVIEDLKRLEPDRLTPIEALARLAELVKRAREDL